MPPPGPGDALSDIASRLDGLALRYMVTGSVAGMFYGLSRATFDLDIVIELGPARLDDFLAAFSGDCYVERSAVARGAMFNVIPLSGGLKTDFIMLRDEPFEQAKFRRRRRLLWCAGTVWVIDPADLVLSKLLRARGSRSERELADVRIIMASGSVAEDDEFNALVEQLDLRELLDASRETRYDA